MSVFSFRELLRIYNGSRESAVLALQPGMRGTRQEFVVRRLDVSTAPEAS
jgi:hypothetical protein